MKYYHFLGELNERQANSIINFFLQCKKDNEAATLLINSAGGSISYMNAIYETLIDSKVRLTTIGTGMVASSAAIIFAMGDERIVLPDTEFIIHKPRFSLKDVTLQRYNCEIFLKRLTKYEDMNLKMLQKTKITKEVFDEKCANGSDWFVTEEELEKYGIITTEDYKGWTNFVNE